MWNSQGLTAVSRRYLPSLDTAVKPRYVGVLESQALKTASSSIKQQICFGSEQFVTKMQSNIDPLLDLTDIPSRQYMPAALSLINYKQQAPSRDEAIRLAYASGNFTMKEVGHYFDLHYSRVSRIINSK